MSDNTQISPKSTNSPESRFMPSVELGEEMMKSKYLGSLLEPKYKSLLAASGKARWMSRIRPLNSSLGSLEEIQAVS